MRDKTDNHSGLKARIALWEGRNGDERSPQGGLKPTRSSSLKKSSPPLSPRSQKRSPAPLSSSLPRNQKSSNGKVSKVSGGGTTKTSQTPRTLRNPNPDRSCSNGGDESVAANQANNIEETVQNIINCEGDSNGGYRLEVKDSVDDNCSTDILQSEDIKDILYCIKNGKETQPPSYWDYQVCFNYPSLWQVNRDTENYNFINTFKMDIFKCSPYYAA